MHDYFVTLRHNTKKLSNSCTWSYKSLIITIARLVLRLQADDPHANCPLGSKFGCTVSQGKQLLHVAKDYQLNVIGVRYELFNVSLHELAQWCIFINFCMYVILHGDQHDNQHS